MSRMRRKLIVADREKLLLCANREVKQVYLADENLNISNLLSEFFDKMLASIEDEKVLEKLASLN